MINRRAAALTSLVVVALLAVIPPAHADPAPGAPGIASAWTTGTKQGLGTSTTTGSKVWYTLGQGIAHEVYYPQADVPNVQDLQFIVTDGASFTDEEKVATTHAVRLADDDSLTYEQVNTDKDGRYRITKTYVTDPARATMLVRTRFEQLSGTEPLQLYAPYNPSLAGSGMGDTGAAVNGQLRGSDGSVASALASSTGFAQTTNGYSGTSSDGFRDLTANHRLTSTYDTADQPGNLVQTAKIDVDRDTTFTLALGFGGTRDQAGSNAAASLAAGWTAVAGEYQDGWHSYVASLAPVPDSVTGDLREQYLASVMSIKAHEDKTWRGAFVASLTHPWGDATNADQCCPHGYHAVWARDLYQMATASLAAGDRAAAERALDYLLNVQRRPDGSYPQNTRLDGTPVWHGLQLDQVAFPTILARQLGRTDAQTYAKLKPSAEFIAHNGPTTPQERWEEAAGYSPSTLAAEIAALVCAADIATANGDQGAADYYLAVADEWQRNVERWTYTTTGTLASHGYYERIDGSGDPNDNAQLTIANGGGTWWEKDVVDAGFLELVRLGVKRADDPHIVNSLSTVDSTIRVAAPQGDIWYRYNHDGYGETSDGRPYTGAGIGRLWPVLSGERGQYELAAGRPAAKYLATMAGSAAAGRQIPEQVWDRADAHGFTFGQPTGSATPLSWAHGQFVRLASNISAGRNLETPSVVADRYTR